MIGQTVHAQRPVPLGSGIFLVVALVAAAIGVFTGLVGWVVFALFPLVLAGTLWLFLPKPQVLHFTDKELVVEGGPRIPYDAIQSLQAPHRPGDPREPGRRCYAIQVLHHDGVLLLSPRLDVPSDDVYRFLFEQLSPGGDRVGAGHLADYLNAQEKHFGAGQVRSYCARAHLGRSLASRSISAVGLSMVATGGLWLASAGFIADGKPWAIFGIVIAFIGGLLFGMTRLDRGETGAESIRKWRRSALVVGPGGMAMAQGDVNGELSWRQVKEVRYSPKPRFFGTSGRIRRGIFVYVEGAQIVIADIYDRPLYSIYQAVWGNSEPGGWSFTARRPGS